MIPGRKFARNASDGRSLGIYIQIPFCQSKCTYCNFHTGVVSPTFYGPYGEAVRRQIRNSASLRGVPVDTVYLGGGTPSLLAPSGLGSLLETLRREYPGPHGEVTLEADPETVTCEKARAWREAGMNRISLGAQSFSDPELRAAGRMHRRQDIYRAFDLLRSAGWENISMDLIAGLPHQDEASWRGSLDQLMALHPEHVSIYLLEVDEESRLGKEILRGGKRYSAEAVPTDEAMADFYELACKRLAGEGYLHYEISNWSQPGRQSIHNLKYWQRQPYLGFGAGAHSFDGRKRWSYIADPAAYARELHEGRSAIEQEETLTPREALEEELFLGLRQLAGVNLAEMERRHGVNLISRLSRLREENLIEIAGTHVRINPAKLTIANEVFSGVLGAADEPEREGAALRGDRVQ